MISLRHPVQSNTVMLPPNYLTSQDQTSTLCRVRKRKRGALEIPQLVFMVAADGHHNLILQIDTWEPQFVSMGAPC